MKKELSFVKNGGLPNTPNKFLECLECTGIVPLFSKENTHCKCNNICLDVDYGRVSIRDWDKIRLFEEI
ncbi:MAG: hypothetical protein BGO12_18290 [Verrucomicrobia bacterium 61-8]|nr:hypothetical protein [Verrucomicrobiota bacterium]OJU99695.1 MAG: hypothetical protein BGO12_18290 [Verrucomicrobia bacterium 61-8]